MKPQTQVKPPKKALSFAHLGRWLDHKIFRIDVYELRGDEVFPSRRWIQRFKIQDVSTWQQIVVCFGVAYIAIKFADGQTVELSDKHEDLFRILRLKVPEKELPWKAV